MGGGGVRVGSGVHDSYTFPVQTDGLFYFPWHRHQIEGPCIAAVDMYSRIQPLRHFCCEILEEFHLRADIRPLSWNPHT